MDVDAKKLFIFQDMSVWVPGFLSSWTWQAVDPSCGSTGAVNKDSYRWSTIGGSGFAEFNLRIISPILVSTSPYSMLASKNTSNTGNML